jgi:YesN/AraC family two-component response regulator
MSQEPEPKGHILLVDDELSLLNALAEFLQEQDYDVDTAPNGVAAKECLSERIYDLMVTDYRMPDISGIELLEFAKNTYPDMEVVLITGYGSKESVIEAIRLGAYNYIEKPFDTVDLLKTIINCLETINLKRRVGTLVEDLRENERHLEQVIKTQNAELISQKHKLLFLDTTKDNLHSIADEINDTAGEIWNHVSQCRKREDTYLSDVNKLIKSCVKGTRDLTSVIENLEGIARQFEVDEPTFEESTATEPSEQELLEGVDTSEAADEQEETGSAIDLIYDELYDFLDKTIGAHQTKNAFEI